VAVREGCRVLGVEKQESGIGIQDSGEEERSFTASSPEVSGRDFVLDDKNAGPGAKRNGPGG
jgi:hypothetical protein